MQALVIVITLICMALMFLLRRDYKIAVLFMTTILMRPVILPFKGITATMAVSLAFVLSELPGIRLHWKRLGKSPMLPYLILLALSASICIVTSPNLHNASDAGYFVLSELFVKYFALVYAFISLRRRRSVKALLTVSFVSLVLMTLVGYVNQLSGYSFFVDSLFEDTFGEYNFAVTTRFRVQATFVNPFDYGYMCVLLALLHLYGFQQKMESLPVLAISQLCCLYGVFACNCRTILFCYAICLLVYFVAVQKKRITKIEIVFGVLAIGVLIFAVSPSMRKIIMNVASIFDPTSVTKGSSLAMRILQFTTVLYYIQGNALFGRGVHFFARDLGWENGSANAVDSDLYGLEGIYLNMLLERGVLGFVLYLSILLLLLVFLVRNRRMGRRLYALGASSLALYIMFSFMTGELLSAAPTFYILGYVLANLHLRRRYLELVGHDRTKTQLNPECQV